MFDNKTMTAILAFFLLSLLLPAAALANAMPVYLEREPYFSLAPREDVPLRVEGEELTIEIEENSSATALVTARYILTNMAAENLTVPLVFPYLSNDLWDFAPVIEWGGERVDYSVFAAGAVAGDYLAEPEEFLAQVDIERIVANLNQPPYKPVHFSDTAPATLYKVTFRPPAERQCRIAFLLDHQQTRVLAFGFSGFEMDRDGRVAVSTYISDRRVGEVGYLLVLGPDTLKMEEKDYDHIEKEEVVIRDFIISKLDLAGARIQNRDRENFYSLFLRELDGLFERGQLVSVYDELVNHVLYRNNISALLFTIHLEPGQRSALQVSFPMRATIDRRELVDYVNTFVYLLQPARHFPEFGGIDINIKLNARSPYIIGSSLELVEEGPGVYSASLDHLPAEDLVFSTYPRPAITFWDRMQARLLSRGDLIIFIFFVAAFLYLRSVWKRATGTIDN